MKAKMVRGKSRKDDNLLLQGSFSNSGKVPIITAATDQMARDERWVFISLEDAVCEMVHVYDDLTVADLTAMIRDAVEAGIAAGTAMRNEVI